MLQTIVKKRINTKSITFNDSVQFVKSIWTQISQFFNENYDEHLIFELLNEPRLQSHEHEWCYNSNCQICHDGAETLNKLNQICLDTIRASGKNNSKRFVLLTGLGASITSYQADDSWKLPKDSIEGRLLVSVHMYTPYSFAMQAPGDIIFAENHKKELAFHFKQLYDHFVSKGIPVIIGEFGAINKNNIQERVKWFSYFVSESSKYGMITCLWDNGDPYPKDTFADTFGYFNRKDCTFFFPEIINAIITMSG